MALSEARRKANDKWNEENLKKRYDRIQLVVPKGRKADIQVAAKSQGLSVNGWINSLIDAALEQEDSMGGSSHIQSAEKNTAE